MVEEWGRGELFSCVSGETQRPQESHRRSLPVTRDSIEIIPTVTPPLPLCGELSVYIVSFNLHFLPKEDAILPILQSRKCGLPGDTVDIVAMLTPEPRSVDSKACALPQRSPFPDSLLTCLIFFPLPYHGTPLRVHVFPLTLFKLIHALEEILNT